MPGEEFIIAESGAVRIEQAGKGFTLNEGESLLLRGGAPLESSGAPLAELLFGPTPQCRNHGD